jgi:excisionase family DNA binding protein
VREAKSKAHRGATVTPTANRPQISQEPSLCTVEEAALRLNLKTTWLYERTRRNAIPHHRFGKYIRFTEADLDAIISMASSSELSSENE